LEADIDRAVATDMGAGQSCWKEDGRRRMGDSIERERGTVTEVVVNRIMCY
jgi:hypothetical protein